MDFEYTQDRRMIADALSRYLDEQYTFELRDQIAHSRDGYSREQWQQLAEMGFIGSLFGEADGGFGGQGLDINVIFEALGHRLVVEPFLPTLMAGHTIARLGSAEQRTILEPVMAGEKRLALAHEEPGYCLDQAPVTTTCQQTDNGWRLNGHKAIVSHAETADVLVVSARPQGAEGESPTGLALFMVPIDAPGVCLQGYPLIDGGRAGEVHLQEVELDVSAQLGTLAEAEAAMGPVLGAGLVALCAEAMGIMDEIKDATLDYLKERKQFGKAIGSFQVLQHRMVDLLLEIEQARSAVIRAADALDTASPTARDQALSAAKYTMGRVGTLVAEEAIQMHGGIGMTQELPLSHYAKRLIMIDHQLGDQDFHLQRFMDLSQVAA